MATKPDPKKVTAKTDLGVPIAKGKIIIASTPSPAIPTKPAPKK